MKSGSQRRTEIKTQRTGKRAAVRAEEVRTQLKRAAKERETQLKDKVLVNPANLHPNNSYGTPDFVVRGYYADMPFTCKECGKPQVDCNAAEMVVRVGERRCVDYCCPMPSMQATRA